MCQVTILTWSKGCTHEISEMKYCDQVREKRRRQKRIQKWFGCMSFGSSSSHPICVVSYRDIAKPYPCPQCVAKKEAAAASRARQQQERAEREKRQRLQARRQQEWAEQAEREKQQRLQARQRAREVADRYGWEAAHHVQGRSHVDAYPEKDLYRQCFDELAAAEYAVHVPAPLTIRKENTDAYRNESRNYRPVPPPIRISSSTVTSSGTGRVRGAQQQPLPRIKRQSRNTLSTVDSAGDERGFSRRVNGRLVYDTAGDGITFREPSWQEDKYSRSTTSSRRSQRNAAQEEVSPRTAVRTQASVETVKEYVPPAHSVVYKPLPLRSEVEQRPVHQIAREYGVRIPPRVRQVHEASDEYGEPLPSEDFLDDMCRPGWRFQKGRLPRIRTDLKP